MGQLWAQVTPPAGTHTHTHTHPALLPRSRHAVKGKQKLRPRWRRRRPDSMPRPGLRPCRCPRPDLGPVLELRAHPLTAD